MIGEILGIAVQVKSLQPARKRGKLVKKSRAEAEKFFCVTMNAQKIQIATRRIPRDIPENYFVTEKSSTCVRKERTDVVMGSAFSFGPGDPR